MRRLQNVRLWLVIVGVELFVLLILFPGFYADVFALLGRLLLALGL